MSPRHVIKDQSPNIRAPVHLTEEVHSFIESGDIFADCRGKTRKLLTERHGNGIVQLGPPQLDDMPGRRHHVLSDIDLEHIKQRRRSWNDLESKTVTVTAADCSLGD